MKDCNEERYFKVGVRRWRKADPHIPKRLRQELVDELMAARRAVKAALQSEDNAAERAARARVQDCKVALGERGQPWWEQPTPACQRLRIIATIRALLRKRGPTKTICPGDAARICGGKHWRDLIQEVRDQAWSLVESGWLDITQHGDPLQRQAAGPIRLRQRTAVDKQSTN